MTIVGSVTSSAAAQSGMLSFCVILLCICIWWIYPNTPQAEKTRRQASRADRIRSGGAEDVFDELAGCRYHIQISNTETGKPEVTVDGNRLADTLLPVLNDGQIHEVVVRT